MRIALASRELYPYVGGGIAPVVAAAARVLSRVAEVTVVTTANFREEHELMRATGDPRLLPDNVRLVFVEEPPPDGPGGFLSHMHAYSARVYEALRETYRDRGPDIIEFGDYLAEGFVTIQAAHTRAPWLADTVVSVRVHTSGEMCAVLDGHMDNELGTVALHEAERYCLRHADRLIWQGGDVLASYERYYGSDALAPAIRIRYAYLDDPGAPPPAGGPEPGAPVRLLYLGRMERRKGVHNLVRGLLGLGRDDWRLTLVGGDTDTGPLGMSMREQLLLATVEDPRIDFHEPVARDQLPNLLRGHDLVVIPSLWECFPNVALEALAHNRPLLTTPVGGLCELAQHGRSGWNTADTSAQAIGAAIADRLDDPDSIKELIASGSPRKVFEELTDEQEFVAGYRELLDAPRRGIPARRVEAPLVSIILPYFKLDDHVEETLDSVAAQTYRRIETIIVNDGSLRPVDKQILERIARRPGITVITQVNSGLGAARNFGISQAEGDYILPLDADDLIEPTFVERCVDVLEAVPELVYVGTWARYMAPDGKPLLDDLAGYMPYGNWSCLMERNNVGGVCTSLFRREVFQSGFAYSPDLTSYEDWLLLRQLHQAGLFGAIIPERLFVYRVRDDSMTREVGSPRLARLVGEMHAHARERAVDWLPADPPRANRADAPELVAQNEVSRLRNALAMLRAENVQLAAGAGAVRDSAAAAQLNRNQVELAKAHRRIAELEQKVADLEGRVWVRRRAKAV
jgi:glycogen(starch) synthase